MQIRPPLAIAGVLPKYALNLCWKSRIGDSPVDKMTDCSLLTILSSADLRNSGRGNLSGLLKKRCAREQTCN